MCRMKIISIRQPWASLIVSGVKDVENRTWSTRYRGPVLIHASQSADRIRNDEFKRRFDVPLPPDGRRGGIVGVAQIVDCVQLHDSKWYAGEYVDRQGERKNHWALVLEKARTLPFIACKGQLGLRSAPLTLLELLDIGAQGAIAYEQPWAHRRSALVSTVP
ncbi:MAG: ASCH domain-containing protein [Beijerinckiaceae bacterium]|nr:ASCH domain-containing protein [Beijerinckiaceae bacterium]